MVKNYISENLEFLASKHRLSKDELGASVDLKRGLVSQYIRGISVPKLETIQKICSLYQITIDDFVNKPLAEARKSTTPEPESPQTAKYVELLEKSLQDKEEIIAALRERLARYDSGDRKNTA